MNVNNSNVFRHTHILFSVLLSSAVLISCSFNRRNKKETTVCDSRTVPNVRLEFFNEFPDVFKNNGGDMYTYDSVKLDDKKYIFLSNLSGMAAVKIDGCEIYLKPDSSQFTVRKNDFCQEVWVGKDVQIVLKLKKVRNFEEDEGEGFYLEGVLELKAKNKIRKIKIHGYSEV